MTGIALIPAFCATTSALFAASVEGMIVLLVLYLISAFFNWIKRRAEQKQSDALPSTSPRPGHPPAPATAPAPVTAAKTWEEELKRLLEGEAPVFGSPAPSPPPPVAAPIIVTVPPPVLAPARPSATRRAAAVEPMSEESEAPSRPLATFRESESAYREGSSLDRRTAARLQKVEALATAEDAYGNAALLHDRVAARMRQVVAQTRDAAPTAPEARRQSAAAAATLAQLRGRASAQQAIVTALVLGPPKAMEN